MNELIHPSINQSVSHTSKEHHANLTSCNDGRLPNVQESQRELRSHRALNDFDPS